VTDSKKHPLFRVLNERKKAKKAVAMIEGAKKAFKYSMGDILLRN